MRPEQRFTATLPPARVEQGLRDALERRCTAAGIGLSDGIRLACAAWALGPLADPRAVSLMREAWEAAISTGGEFESAGSFEEWIEGRRTT